MIGLNQFQAKESTDIHEDVYNNILAEIKKMRIKNLDKISIPDMKLILKKLRYNQYYEHNVYIISKLTKRPPPSLTRETEDRIKHMFKQIQEPFSKHCPENRTNFLSYSYVLNKLFYLIGMPEYVKYFPLLKSREKLRAQDAIWEKICNELYKTDPNWIFYPSI